MKAVKHINLKRLFPIVIIFAIFLFINLSVHEKFDDHAFTQSFKAHNSSIISWGIFYFNNWSGRVLPHGIAVMLMSTGYTLFRICNSVMQTALVFLIGGYCTNFAKDNYKSKIVYTVAAFFAFLCLIPFDIHAESDFWQIASVLYLWAMVMALFCIKPFWLKLHGGEQAFSRGYWVLAILAAAYAASYEQTAPLIIVFGIIAELYCKIIKKKRFSKLNLAIISVSLAVFLICLLSPGNALRTSAEILRVSSFYTSLSFIEKGFWGLVMSAKVLVESYAALLLILSAVVAFIAFTHTHISKINKYTSLIPCGYFGLLFVLQYMRKAFIGQALPWHIDYKLYNIIAPHPASISYSVDEWFSTALAIFVCLLLGALLYIIIDHKSGFAPALFYSAAFALIAIIGFTPSGMFYTLRTAFIPGILFIIVILRLANTYNKAPSEVNNVKK